MSRLLYDERPLVVNPTLAALIGLPEAIVLQQVHYWVMINAQAGRNAYEGYYWTYNSYREWAEQFPFYSRNTVIRAIKKLEEGGYLLSGTFNKAGQDRTKWYRVNYARLLDIPKMGKSIYPKRADAITQDGEMQIPGVGTPLPKTTPETNPPESPTEKPKRAKAPLKEGVVNAIFERMRAYLGFPGALEKDPIPNYGQEGQAIKRLLTRGYTPEEILTYWQGRVDKAGGFVTMVYVNQDIDRPAAGRKPGDNGKRRGSLPTEGELESKARELGITA